MIWLIGNKGMLGTEVGEAMRGASIQYLASDIEVDITDYDRLHDFSIGRKINWIINCSAYTAVDRAEEEKEKAFAINAEGAGNIARIAAETGAVMIHISTDYVFDGEKEGPYSENDRPNPTGVYGLSKLSGEEKVRQACPRHFILRTAWLYGKNGANFVHTMLRLFNERDEVRVVADQWGSPTCAKDLAAAILSIVNGNSSKYGIFNFTNEGRTNWHEFSMEIYARARQSGITGREVRIVPITTPEYPTKARRPMNSYLSKEKIQRELGIACRPWRDALAEFVVSVKKAT